MDAATTVTQFAKMLENLAKWLDAGDAFAEQKKFAADVLAEARLAPDQYQLTRQVQSACDQAKFAAAYLSGTKAPSHPDTEKTIADLRTRIATCLDYLRGMKGDAFAGAAERRVAPTWLGGKWMRGDDYLTAVAIPNFYFHVTTAYAILRHNGVPLGKMEFIGGLPPTHDA
jgi:hypothetical protein